MTGASDRPVSPGLPDGTVAAGGAVIPLVVPPVAGPGGDPSTAPGAREGEAPGGAPDDTDLGTAAGGDDDKESGGEESGAQVGALRHPRPTSRRGRAAARRSGAGSRSGRARGRGGPRHMTSTSTRRWSRLVSPAGPVTRTGLQRRRNRTMAAMAVAAVAGVGLSLWGTSLVRNSTAGEYVEPAIGPDEPGYQAFVVATPTLAVFGTNDDGDLTSAALLSLRSGDDGGAVTVVPVSTLVPEAVTETDDPGDGDGDGTSPTTGGGTSATEGSGDAASSGGSGSSSTTRPDVAGATIAEAYDDGGVDAATVALGDVLDVGVDGAVEVDAEAWADMVGPAGDVTVQAPEAVGVWPAGTVTLGPDQVGAYMGYDGTDEGDVARAERQAAFWQAWLGAVGDGGAEAAPAKGDIGRFVEGIARGASSQVLPVVESDAGGETLEPDPGPAAELIAAAVPYPLSPAPGARVRLRLLNGTDEPSLTAEVASQLVAAGAEITIAGNASSFDVTETTYTYDDPEDQADAQRFADTLGVGRVVEGEQVSVTTQPSGTATTLASVDDPEDEIDMTIVLGSDVQDLIRRLESTG